MKITRLNKPNTVLELLEGKKHLIIDSVHMPFSKTVRKIETDEIFIVDFRDLYSNMVTIHYDQLRNADILFAQLYEFVKKNNIERTILLNIDFLLLFNSEQFIYGMMKYIDKFSSISSVTVSINNTSKKIFFETIFPILFDVIIEYITPTEFIVHRHKDIDISGRKFYQHYHDYDVYNHLKYEDGSLYYFNVRSEINDEFSEKALYETIYEMLSLEEIDKFFKKWASKYISNFEYCKCDGDIQSIVNNIVMSTKEIGGGKLEPISVSEKKIIIAGYDLFPQKIDNFKGPIHHLYLYTMIEILNRTTGETWEGREVSCQNNGDDKCLFVLEVKESENANNSSA